MRLKKLNRLLVLALMASMPLTAWFGTTEAQAAPKNVKYKETLHIAVTQQAPSMDLHKNSSVSARQLCDGTVWEKLVTLNSKAEAVPELAEKYEATNGGKTLVFTLRKGVKFHDGSIMTANDVVASMNRWLAGFSSAGKMVGKARFVAVDDHTVKIDGESSLILLPAMIAGAAQPASITTAAACKNEDTSGFLKEYIGTGPYKFSEWKQDQYIKLVRFDDYVPYGTKGVEMDGWSGYKAAHSKILQFDLVPDQATGAIGLEAGQFDVIFNISYDDFARLEKNPNITAVSSQMGTVALIPNHKQGIASKQYFRTAINAALDFEALLTATYGNGYELGSSYMDAGQPFWISDAGSEHYNQKNVAKAKKILADNGYAGEPFTVLVSTLNKMDNMGVAIKAQLEKIGIPVKLLIVDWATLTEYRKDPKAFDMFLTTFAEVPVPSLKLYYGPMYPGWSDDEKLSTLFLEMVSASTLEEAKAKWHALQAYSWEYLPIISTGHFMGMFAWQKNVSGVNMYSGGPKFWNAGVALP